MNLKESIIHTFNWETDYYIVVPRKWMQIKIRSNSWLISSFIWTLRSHNSNAVIWCSFYTFPGNYIYNRFQGKNGFTKQEKKKKKEPKCQLTVPSGSISLWVFSQTYFGFDQGIKSRWINKHMTQVRSNAWGETT